MLTRTGKAYPIPRGVPSSASDHLELWLSERTNVPTDRLATYPKRGWTPTKEAMEDYDRWLGVIFNQDLELSQEAFAIDMAHACGVQRLRLVKRDGRENYEPCYQLSLTPALEVGGAA